MSNHEFETTISQINELNQEIADTKRALALDWQELHPDISPADSSRSRPKWEEHSDSSRSRPKWEEYFPADDDDEKQERYQDFLGSLPAHMQENVEHLRQTIRDREAQQVSAATEAGFGVALQEHRDARRHILGAAARHGAIERAKNKVIGSSNLPTARRPTQVELAAEEHKSQTGTRYEQEQVELMADPEVRAEVTRRQTLKDKYALEHGMGYVETAQGQDIIKRSLESLRKGKPMLLTGETGTAKSALAEHIARDLLGKEPLKLRGNPDMNAFIMMGKTGLRGKDGVTETVADFGIVTKAMNEGLPLIIDEIDLIPEEQLDGLNNLLQLRSGSHFQLQEDGGQDILIKPGFCVIGTANTRSELHAQRYRREEIGTATIQRFHGGAGVHEVHYPDFYLDPNRLAAEAAPPEHLRLALAVLADERGDIDLPKGVTIDEMSKLLRVSFFSELMFAQPTEQSSSYANLVDTERMGKPALERGVIAPREWIGWLSRIRDNRGASTINDELTSFIIRQSGPDRAILAKLARTQGLLKEVDENRLKIPRGSLTGLGG